jgi:hypothetical protein
VYLCASFQFFYQITILNMKNVRAMALLALGMWALAACSNVDPNVTAKVDETIQASQKIQPSVEQAAQSVADLGSKLNAYGEQSKSEGAKLLANQINSKYAAAVAQYQATAAELQQLSADHAAGKIKNEAAEARLAELQRQVNGYDQSFVQFSQLAQRDVSELAQIGETMLAERVSSLGAQSSSELSPDTKGTESPDAATAPAADAPQMRVSDGEMQKAAGGRAPSANPSSGATATPQPTPNTPTQMTKDRSKTPTGSLRGN